MMMRGYSEAKFPSNRSALQLNYWLCSTRNLTFPPLKMDLAVGSGVVHKEL